MIEGLLNQFAGSGEAAQLVGELQKQGLSPQQAKGAVAATAEGAADHAGALAGLLGGGGAMGAIGGMLGGGGLGGMLGGSGGAPAGGAGLPPQIVETIAGTVASRTGLSPQMAQKAVATVLPRLLTFVKSKMGSP